VCSGHVTPPGRWRFDLVEGRAIGLRDRRKRVNECDHLRGICRRWMLRDHRVLLRLVPLAHDWRLRLPVLERWPFRLNGSTVAGTSASAPPPPQAAPAISPLRTITRNQSIVFTMADGN
jgi:hypothetical protein